MENIFAEHQGAREWSKSRSVPPWIMHTIHECLELEVKRKTGDEDICRQFYRTILCIYSFIIQENSLALNVSAGYSTDNNVTLDTVQCAYTIHIYKSTFALSADSLRLLSLSRVLSFSHTLVLSRSFAPFSLLAPLKSELSFSRFLELSLVT